MDRQAGFFIDGGCCARRGDGARIAKRGQPLRQPPHIHFRAAAGIGEIGVGNMQDVHFCSYARPTAMRQEVDQDNLITLLRESSDARFNSALNLVSVIDDGGMDATVRADCLSRYCLKNSWMAELAVLRRPMLQEPYMSLPQRP